ncbi:MAG: hypothetical protein AAFY76_12765 [Cyanobacteria bacterium J06649_11]
MKFQSVEFDFPYTYSPEMGIGSEKSENAADGIDSELKSLHLKYVPAVM